jgi:hypothetical protein
MRNPRDFFAACAPPPLLRFPAIPSPVRLPLLVASKNKSSKPSLYRALQSWLCAEGAMFTSPALQRGESVVRASPESRRDGAKALLIYK